MKKTYVYANGEILAQHDGDVNANRYFYLHDRLGSVREVIDADGLVKNYYTYDPFGQLTAENAETIENPFKFTGQYFDSETGQYYLRARQYDPVLGRFTSRDSVAGKFEEPMSLHKYLYCENEPISRIDPMGLWYEWIHQSFGAYGRGQDGLGPALFDYASLDRDKPADKFPSRQISTWLSGVAGS